MADPLNPENQAKIAEMINQKNVQVRMAVISVLGVPPRIWRHRLSFSFCDCFHRKH